MNIENVNIRKSRRAKRLLLSVNLDGSVDLVIPFRASYKEAEKFLSEKQEWLLKALARYRELRQDMPARKFVTGEKIPCFDCEYMLKVDYDEKRERSSLKESGDELIVKGKNNKVVRSALVAWYKKQAHNYFAVRSRDYSELLGVDIKTVAISEAKTQWGSCNARSGRLSFNWRLLLGPSVVADYVVVHEVAHMKHQNHSMLFWQTVEKLMPDYKEYRKWLKKNGYKLVL